MKKEMNLINSREDYYKSSQRRSKIRKYFPEISVFLSLIVLMSGFMTVNSAMQNSLDQLDAQIEERGDLALVFERLEQQKQSLVFYEDVLAQISGNEPSLSESVRSLYRLVPTDSHLIQLDLNGGQFKLTGQSRSQAEISDFCSSLEEETALSSGEIISISYLETAGNSDLWEYTMVFDFSESGEERLVQ